MENVNALMPATKCSAIRKAALVATLLLLIVLPYHLRATVVYVNDASLSGDIYCQAAGSNSNPGTKGLPLATLQFALANFGFTNGDTIYVDAGTYTDQNLAVTNADAGVVIQGAGRNATIFDGINRTSRWMVVSGSNVHLHSMTVKRYGHSTGLSGQALTLQDATGLLVEDLLLDDQGTSGGEASIYIATTSTISTSATITNCVIQNTNGNFGGGIDVCSNTISATPTLTVTINNTLVENCGKNNFNGGALLIYKGLSAGGTTQAPVVTANNCVFGSPGRGNVAARGGAIYVDNGATLHLNGACIGNNQATDVAGPDGGGGIYILDGTVNMVGGMVTNNTAVPGTPKYGGGIFVNKLFSGTSTLNIQQTVISGNLGLDGAGIYLDNSTTTLRNVLMYGNTASDEGGAITLNDAACNISLTNCTIASNTTSSGSSTRHGGLQNKQCASAIAKNCIFWGNTRADVAGATNLTVSFSIVDPTGTPTFTDGGNNTTTDPLFMDAGNADYRLLNGTSPAVNTGTLDGGAAPTSDLVSTARVSQPDKGAYELLATTILPRDCPGTRMLILPLDDAQFALECSPAGLRAYWHGSADAHLSAYWIEASHDATHFTAVQGARLTPGSETQFSLDLPADQPYFRLAATDIDGVTISYSEVATRPTCDPAATGLFIFPSLATNHVRFEAALQQEGAWHLEVMDLAGRLVLAGAQEHGPVSGRIDLSHMPAGTYLLRILPSGAQPMVQRFVKI